MSVMVRALMLVSLIAGAPDGMAQPILDMEAVPKVSAAGRDGYRGFLLMNLPRAYAVGSQGAFGWQGGDGTIETARAKALASCGAKGASDCAVYAENLDVVWQGRTVPRVTPPGALTSTWNYEVVPDPRYLWRGPGAAVGVYVWGHGLTAGADSRGQQPQGHVRAFNNAGFDIVRFDRDPRADVDRERAAGWLEDALVDVRKRGYRKVIVGGQSRGAWNSLQTMRRPDLADAVIAISPAAHGTGGSTNLTAQYDDLRQLTGAIAPSRTRLAFVQFQADPYAADPQGRKALIDRLRPKLGGVLIIDQPDGLSGHGGGNSAAFARSFGPCLLRFVTDPSPPAGC